MDNLESIIKDLINLPNETEWVEFKTNNSNPQEIGEYVSALANSACLHNKEHAYLIFGIDDKTHSVIGTNYSPKSDKIGNQEIENWLATQLSPRIDFKIIELKYHDKQLAVFVIDNGQCLN